MVLLRKLEDQPISTDIRMCDGLFVKHTVFAEGSYIPQHSHQLPHLSVIATGAVRVWVDGELLGDYVAPAGVVVEAFKKHTFLALQPQTTILCVHRTDENGEIPIHEEHQFDLVED